MFTQAKAPMAILLGLLLFSAAVSAATTAQTTNVPITGVSMDDDDMPEVTDRVARISFLSGDAKIRRAGSEDWEAVSLNLPIVEGDEISTEPGARLEIQFDKHRHLRLAENSYLRISTLKDEGIAVSLSLGRLILRVTSFDKDAAFFEIDAPKTTLALQKAGRYSVDAGDTAATGVTTEISAGGEARIYSENAGFTLKDGRSATVYLTGNRLGEWDTADAAGTLDDFAKWSLDREEVIERRLRDAYYNKYYDDDIYGADDLNEAGEWVNTPEYGNVWRPYRSSIAGYADWSPYRYGHWRWMAPYGWIWVNDEPWGWATYHHGRWVYWGGHWVWTPYGYYRTSRSWWSPAYVVINIFNNNVCWYPAPYHRRRNRHDHRDPRNPPPRKVSTRVPRGTSIVPPVRNPTGRTKDEVPVRGVVTLDKEAFGTRSIRPKTAPEAIAKTIVTRSVDEPPDIVEAPTWDRRRTDISVEKPKVEPVVERKAVGAAPRRGGGAMDPDLRTTKILGGRAPQRTENPPSDPIRTAEPRKTGAVDRPPIIRSVDPVRTDVEEKRPERPSRSQPPPRQQPPVISPPSDGEKVRSTPPREVRSSPSPPKQTERPRSDPPPTKSAPREETKSPPKSSESKPPTSAPSRKEKPDNR